MAPTKQRKKSSDKTELESRYGELFGYKSDLAQEQKPLTLEQPHQGRVVQSVTTSGACDESIPDTQS